MANTLTFDFRHYYQKGDRRASEQIAYQWDLGHVAEIYVPVNATYTIGYWFPGYTRTADYAVDSIAADTDGGYKVLAHIPNSLFERYGELRVYITGSSDGQTLTTYEGYVTIRGRAQPDDYVDDDPDNTAKSIIDAAEEFAQESEAWAVGKIDGTDVPSTADQYQNNAKYYSDEASSSATLAESYAIGGTSSRTGEDTDNAKYYKELAESAAQSLNADRLLGDFATLESSSTATQAYSVGDYLTYNGYLYKVTVAIASGDTITVGTNVEQTTVGDELNSLHITASGDGTVTIGL